MIMIRFGSGKDPLARFVRRMEMVLVVKLPPVHYISLPFSSCFGTKKRPFTKLGRGRRERNDMTALKRCWMH